MTMFSARLRTIGLSVFCLANFYLAVYFGREVLMYLAGAFNYDGFRYILPLAIADLGFLPAIALIVASRTKASLIWMLISAASLQNLAIGGSVELIPFLELGIGIASILLIAFAVLRKSVKGAPDSGC